MRDRADKRAYAALTSRDRGGEPFDRFAFLVPARDEPDFAGSPIVEVEAQCAQPRRFLAVTLRKTSLASTG